MIVRTLEELAGTPRRVVSAHSESIRFLLAEDGMGFSFNLTTIDAGLEIDMEYKHHFEAVYCLSGEGSIEDRATGEIHAIGPGTIYALNEHDAHILRSETKLELICVFNPALVGTEQRAPSGGFPPP